MNKEIKVAELSRVYDASFRPSKEYLKSMPDLQNTSGSYIHIPINMVGISNFLMPLRVIQKDGDHQEVQASVSGTVSLEAEKAGINMSRIIRTAYNSIDDVLSIDRLCDVLTNYKKDLETFDAHIILKFPYRMWQTSLRSRKEDGSLNGAWHYYDVVFDVNLDRAGKFTKRMFVDFTYSSACPCSTALSEHAAYERGKYGIPHSQRSVARIGLEFDKMIWIEDVVWNCRKALKTEVQTFVKREDEQSFAELNGAHTKFVEDAIRILADMCEKIPGVKDYKIICSHAESLHPHNAISLIVKGTPNGFTQDISYEEWMSLVK